MSQQANNSHINITSTQLSPASQPHNNSHNPNFIRRLITTLVLLFLIVTAVSFIAWLIIHPLCPVFTVNSFSVSNFTVSDNSSRVKADYDFVFSIKNPNKKVSLVVDRFEFRLLYKKTVVIKTLKVEAVYLEKPSQQNRSPKFLNEFGEKLHRREFDEISEAWRKGEVSFNVKMGIRTRFKSRIWLTKQSLMTVSCMDLVVKFLEPGDIGKLKGGGKDCPINFA